MYSSWKAIYGILLLDIINLKYISLKVKIMKLLLSLFLLSLVKRIVLGKLKLFFLTSSFYFEMLIYQFVYYTNQLLFFHQTCKTGKSIAYNYTCETM